MSHDKTHDYSKLNDDTGQEKEVESAENFSLASMIQMKGKSLDKKLKMFDEFSQWEYSKQELLYMREICTPADRSVKSKDPYTGEIKEMIMFGSNNYLGFANHPYIKEKVLEAIDNFGTGLGGPPLLNGSTSLHHELQRRLANIKNKDDALVYSSGYNANVGLVSALIDKKDIVIFDQYSHASFIDGLKMNSIRPRSFKHNDIDSLRKKLETVSKDKDENVDIFVATEGVFSMDGDIAILDEIIKLKKDFDFYLIVDDAHGLGVVGENGHGIHEHFQTDEIDIIMGTFSKTLAVNGGFIAADKEIINYLRWMSRSYMFSASIPPTVVAAVLAGLDLLDKEPWRPKKLKENAQYLVGKLADNHIHVDTDSAIVCVIVPESLNIRKAGKRMHDMGIFVNTIEFPAVPKELQRFRISIMADHTKEDIDFLVECLMKVLGEAS
jgi:glycine C-acetyltransferase